VLTFTLEDTVPLFLLSRPGFVLHEERLEVVGAVLHHRKTLLDQDARLWEVRVLIQDDEFRPVHAPYLVRVSRLASVGARVASAFDETPHDELEPWTLFQLGCEFGYMLAHELAREPQAGEFVLFEVHQPAADLPCAQSCYGVFESFQEAVELSCGAEGRRVFGVDHECARKCVYPHPG
jgi:hypothetical protein